MRCLVVADLHYAADGFQNLVRTKNAWPNILLCDLQNLAAESHPLFDHVDRNLTLLGVYLIADAAGFLDAKSENKTSIAR